ncbi:MAG: hypothetical protein K2Y22_08570 [Candidatus Obscuribacterales bacterium]|nr:hypothetical protein [Candidatus Obscuribacterales bacterium]
MSQKIVFRLSLLAGLLLTLAIPALATNSATVIGPTDSATVVTGINTAGTVRVNSLGCLVSLVNIFVNGYEIVGLITAASIFTTVARIWVTNKQLSKGRLVTGALFAISALSSPSTVDYLLTAARDANLFS